MDRAKLMATCALYGVPDPDDPWGSVVLIDVHADDDVDFRGPNIGRVFVIEKGYGLDAKYKNSGGRKDPTDTDPRHTGAREFQEEVGLPDHLFPEEALVHIGTWKVSKPDGTWHWKCFFRLKIHKSDLKYMNPYNPGNEGEFPRYFAEEGFWALVRSHTFHPFHYEEMVRYGLIEPKYGLTIPWVTPDHDAQQVA